MRFQAIPVPEALEPSPTSAELAAIEAEWPAIAADLDALDAEIRSLTVASTLSEVDIRRARRARRTALRSLPVESWRGEAA